MRQQRSALNMCIGRSIRQQRYLNGMSQDALGKQIGVSYRQIQKYERGHSAIDASILYVVAQCLNVPVSWFYEDASGLLKKDGIFK